MTTPTMCKQVASLIAPIRAISMGGLAHEYVCGDRLRERATSAIGRLDQARTAPRSANERYGRAMHASGLAGAVGTRALVRPVTLPLDLLVGTGRHRYTGPERLAAGRQVTYIEALLNHPLDTGLLGLVSAYNLAKHAMIAGTVGAVCGAALGVVLWPFRGRPYGMAFCPFVEVWAQRGAFSAGVFGALMGSCFIWAPHNYIVVQCLRVLTAVPKFLANVAGYAAGALIALGYLLLHDAATGASQAAQKMWRTPTLLAADVGAQPADLAPAILT